MIEKAHYNSDGSLDWTELYKYDSAGNRIEEAWYNSDGSLMWKHLYKYDSEGNMIEETHYDGEIMTPTQLIEYEIVYR
jgi:hypothetical protein